MMESLERLRQSPLFWTALTFFGGVFGVLTLISLAGMPFEDYTAQARLLGLVGLSTVLLIGVFVLALNPLRAFSGCLGRAIRTSVRFVRENVLFVASVLLSILLLLLLGRLLGHAAVPAIAAGLALANVGIIIGILRIFGSRYALGPSGFFDSFDKGLSRWEFLCRPSAVRTIMAFQGRPYCLQMPPYSHERPEIVYVAGLDDFRNGVIECDVYLPSNTLINILFRADIPAHRYYGARLDTRPQDSTNYPLFNKFLRRDGLQRWFGEAPDQGTKTTPNAWHHLKVVVAEDMMQLFRDEELVASWTDALYHSGQVGIMAELGVVCIDNFRITSLPAPLHHGQL